MYQDRVSSSILHVTNQLDLKHIVTTAEGINLTCLQGSISMVRSVVLVVLNTLGLAAII